MAVTELITKQQERNLSLCHLTTHAPINAQERDSCPNPQLSPGSGCRCTGLFCKAEPKPACNSGRDESPNHQRNDVKPFPLDHTVPSRASLKCSSAKDAAQHWGEPRTLLDIQELFVRSCYRGESPTLLPWCNEPLAAQFLTIADKIIELNQYGYLTIDSQPAVNGVKSDDEIYGWGHKGGYVYQKAYVEFFISPYQLSTLKQRLKHQPHFTFVAANKSGDLQTNIPYSRTGDRCSNVVTWGVFPDCEIVQRTVVDLASFVEWKEEALELWLRLARCYPEASKARTLLETIGEEWYLVNVVNDDYHDPKGLFTFFEEDRLAQDERQRQQQQQTEQQKRCALQQELDTKELVEMLSLVPTLDVKNGWPAEQVGCSA
ncbi:hypothetical protein BGZ72_007523 [Mortierella alpina]|nr:hypothetical protein BGZ72_007523 [Mortierella alpina]